jgi:quinoprotein glucose dehydrogenase
MSMADATRITLAAALAVYAFVSTVVAGGQTAAERTVWDGVYTEAQAERGARRYADACAICHGAEMTGGPGVPGLAGVEFMFTYNNASALALFDYMKMNMPPGQQGTFSDAQYVELVAATLKRNGFPAGETDLPADPAALKAIRILRTRP